MYATKLAIDRAALHAAELDEAREPGNASRATRMILHDYLDALRDIYIDLHNARATKDELSGRVASLEAALEKIDSALAKHFGPDYA